MELRYEETKKFININIINIINIINNIYNMLIEFSCNQNDWKKQNEKSN